MDFPEIVFPMGFPWFSHGFTHMKAISATARPGPVLRRPSPFGRSQAVQDRGCPTLLALYQGGKPWENHGETMGKPWENHGKNMGKPWKTMGKPIGKRWKIFGHIWEHMACGNIWENLWESKGTIWIHIGKHWRNMETHNL